MAKDKHKMQADGSGTKRKLPDENGELASRRASDGKGESSGGSYPNPHGGSGDKNKSGKFKGGQSNRAYYGSGQLGEKDVGETNNAPSEED